MKGSFHDDNGATAVEYAIIATLVAAVIVAIVIALGENTIALFQALTDKWS